ncbi:MAG: hypothetical protein ACOY93_04295 [Bacillota bacterium]
MEMEADVRRRALLWAAGSLILLLLIHGLGSGGFHIKLTELGYVIGTYLFVAGSAYRIVQWAARPGARMYLRGFLGRLKQRRAARRAGATLLHNLAAQRFIYRRSALRWLAHFAISWGCLLSFALTFPLVLGWLQFRFVEPMHYQVVAMGIPTITFPLKSPVAALLFNGLNLSALLMVTGLVLAYIGRIRRRRDFPEGRPDWDLMPLHLLMAVGLTGLAITVDYKFFDGRSYPIWAVTHQIAVVLMLVWFPFSKLFHFLIRPLALAVETYHTAEAERAQQTCRMCHRPYAPERQVSDLSELLGEEGFSQPVVGDFGRPIPDREMIQYCPDCKRQIRARRYLHMEVRHA